MSRRFAAAVRCAPEHGRPRREAPRRSLASSDPDGGWGAWGSYSQIGRHAFAASISPGCACDIGTNASIAGPFARRRTCAIAWMSRPVDVGSRPHSVVDHAHVRGRKLVRDAGRDTRFARAPALSPTSARLLHPSGDSDVFIHREAKTSREKASPTTRLTSRSLHVVGHSHRHTARKRPSPPSAGSPLG